MEDVLIAKKWLFKLKDGSSLVAFFTDEEIKAREKKYPEVNWVWA